VGRTAEFNFSLAPRDDVGAAVGLDDAKAEVEALLDALNMADDADSASAYTQLSERVDGEVERLGVEGTEPAQT
jgi:hypothetical protein